MWPEVVQRSMRIGDSHGKLAVEEELEVVL
jgi:hypothetical protein